jgi:hypothetical protein
MTTRDAPCHLILDSRVSRSGMIRDSGRKRTRLFVNCRGQAPAKLRIWIPDTAVPG